MLIISQHARLITRCDRATGFTYLSSLQLLLLPDRHNQAMVEVHRLQWQLDCISSEPAQILRDKSTARRSYRLMALQNWT